MSGILTEIVSLMTGGITGIATGIGSGLSDLATNIFLSGTGETQTLSVFGALICIFAGCSLAIGLSRWVVNFCSSLGSRNR